MRNRRLQGWLPLILTLAMLATLAWLAMPAGIRTGATPAGNDPSPKATAGATPHATNETRNRVALDRAELRVLARGSGTPIAGARLDFRQGAETAHMVTGPDGRAILPRAGDAETAASTLNIRITARGYVQRRESLTIASGARHIVELARGASLTLEFRDAQGRPVPRLRAALLPPLAQGSWQQPNWRHAAAHLGQHVPNELAASMHAARLALPQLAAPYGGATGPAADWIRTASETGQITWRGLAPHVEFRWGQLDRDAPIVAPVPSPVASGPQDISGALRLQPGEHRKVVVLCRTLTSIRGRLGHPAGTDQANVVVALYGVDDGGVTREQTLRVAGRTAFQFLGVPPGDKLLRCTWQNEAEGQHHARFANRLLRVAAGETKDVGILAPRASRDGAMRFRLLPPGGAPPETATKVVVQVMTRSLASVGSFDLATNFVGYVHAPIGRPVCLWGLPPGRVRLRAQYEDSGCPADQGWPEERSWSFFTPDPGLRELHCEERRITVRLDPGALPFPESAQWQLHLRHVTEGTIVSHTLSAADEQSHSLTLTPGTYDVLTIPGLAWSKHFAPNAKTSYASRRGVSLHADTSLVLGPAQRGRRISGRIDGLVRTFLGFNLEGWPTSFTPFQARTDEGGAFVLPCVPRGRTLREVAAGTNASIRAGAQDIQGQNFRSRDAP